MYQIIKTYAVGLMAPTAFIGLCFICAFILWRRRPRIAKYCAIAGVALFFGLGINPITEGFLSWYEGQYPALEIKNLSPQQVEQIKYVLVLGGGYTDTPNQPISSQIAPAAVLRLVEGIRLWHALPNTILAISGAGWEKRTEAEAMADLAQQLGVPKEKIYIEKLSENTHDHVKYMGPLLGKSPFILVTSANHMPRAMRIFKKAGLNPLAAPTGHILSGEYHIFHNKPPYPRGDNLNAMDTLYYEWVGMIWGKLKGEI